MQDMDIVRQLKYIFQYKVYQKDKLSKKILVILKDKIIKNINIMDLTGLKIRPKLKD